MGVDRVLFLLVAFATHGAVGYALVATFAGVDPRLGALLAVAPDVDLLFDPAWGPAFVHRGFTHAPTFLLACTGVAYAVRRRRTDALAVALALGSHLAVDALSPMGLPLLLSPGDLPSPGLHVHGPALTVLLWTLAGALLVRHNSERITSLRGARE
ncbi:metal-dependent hydrolase [Natronomonas salina]|uniref:metal-dependent hydrolase n=1 Tax=Natronomonas salina TaxID=1710540 RepID=UPI0015B42E68|nr:metal-dependent hydrolase [Natronomonas salina]QLD90088.1 metal-dependent hydrolase [Natronomonas salina]